MCPIGGLADRQKKHLLSNKSRINFAEYELTMMTYGRNSAKVANTCPAYPELCSESS